MLDQSGLVIERPGTAAAGLAGVGPVRTNRALGAGDRASRPGPGGPTAGVCFYLVDTWCLGVKNAAGPRQVDRRRLGGFIQQIFSSWDEPAVQVPLELGGRSSTARSGTHASWGSSRTRTSGGPPGTWGHGTESAS